VLTFSMTGYLVRNHQNVSPHGRIFRWGLFEFSLFSPKLNIRFWFRWLLIKD
jgi:hypothetical protein